jgi:hypothetical protein
MLAKLARTHNKAQQGMRAGAGIKIQKTRGNTLISRIASEGAFTQSEFNAMLADASAVAVLESMIASGDLYFAVYDVAIEAVLDWFNLETIDVCGLGSRDFLVL